MKYKLPQLFTLLFSWIVGGSQLYYITCCGVSGALGVVEAASSSTAAVAAKKLDGTLLLKDAAAFSTGSKGHFR